MIPVEIQPWYDRAACLKDDVDPEVFFPPKGASSAPAKRICRDCPVRDDCLAYAVTNGIREGIWGGAAEKERRRLRKRVA